MIGDGSWTARQRAFIAMERKHELFALRVDGWSPWRVVRHFVFRKLENLPLSQPGRPAAVRSVEALVATFRLIRLLFKGERRDLLVKTCRSGLRVKCGDRFRDVYFDGLLAGDVSHLKMEEINSPDFDEQAALAVRPAELDPVVFTFWGRILGALLPPRVGALCRSMADTLHHELGLELAPSVLKMRVSTVFWQARLYRLLLARIKPQAILVSDTGEYGLRIAAGREKVPFIELQHGVFDARHPDAIPAWVGGAAEDLILPDILASRGRYWIECLADTRQGRDHAVPVGNEFIDEARLRRKARNKAATLHLVLTTQGLDTERLVRWIEAMTEAAPAAVDWRLSIKLHPLYDQETQKFSGLEKDGRIRVIGGSDLPNVFDLLSEADLHLSIASACHFDAAALGVRSVIIPLAGHDSMLHVVDGKQFLLARTSGDVWNMVASPQMSDIEQAHRFSEPDFVENMQKLVIRARSGTASPPSSAADFPMRRDRGRSSAASPFG
ncbi:MAG: hypothetical protein GY844_35700 [Bradyrhizobium sp.]|nr:hypothetical protein [Bradyrhizobium sp.]